MLSLTVSVSLTVWAVLGTYHVSDLHASLTFFFSPWALLMFFQLACLAVFLSNANKIVFALPFNCILGLFY